MYHCGHYLSSCFCFLLLLLPRRWPRHLSRLSFRRRRHHRRQQEEHEEQQ